METTVRLLSHTTDPINTLKAIWDASRSNDPIPDPSEKEEHTAEARELFEKILNSGIPVAENISFTFLLEGVSISLREQLVRHRIGVKAGERLGVDFIPDLADSTWWAQSMRILDMGLFFEDDRYIIADTIRENPQALIIYEQQMSDAEDAYNDLLNQGIPKEDARDVIPLGATHRLTWTLNLAALKHIVGKRGCWILQLGLWKPVILGMIEELATKIDPIFRNLVQPPCMNKGAFTECKFKLDNERRLAGEDEIPPCALYLVEHANEAMTFVAGLRRDCKTIAWNPESDGEHTDSRVVTWMPVDDGSVGVAAAERMYRMKRDYSNLWGMRL